MRGTVILGGWPVPVGALMAYRDFSIDDLKHQFGLRLEERSDLFGGVPPVPVSQLLQQILQENLPLALAISTEKARSELIIAPVLLEVWRQLDRSISLFSGVDFNVDPAQGLNGVCDFLLGLSPEQLTIEAPVAVVAEAKNENMKQGFAQCIAGMVAAQLFNRKRQKELETIHGAVTTGNNWRFLRLAGQVVYVDLAEYYIKEVGRVVGILVHVLRAAQQTQPHAA
jgi:hypothetical protein